MAAGRRGDSQEFPGFFGKNFQNFRFQKILDRNLSIYIVNKNPAIHVNAKYLIAKKPPPTLMKNSKDCLKKILVESRSVLLLLAFALCCSVGRTQPLPADLVSRWMGEGNVQDSVGSNNGTINTQIGFVPGIVGQAFHITGGIVQVPHAADISPSNLTVQAWVRATSPGTFRYILNKAQGAGGVSYALYTGGGGGAIFFVTLDNGAGSLLSPAADPTQVWDGNWHQLTGVFDGISSHLYVDGVEVGTGTTTGAAAGVSYSSPGPLIFGDYQVARGLPYAGDFDEVKIFNRVLTGTEIADTFANVGSTTGSENLVSWYKGEGNALDSKGTNNGTATIAPFDFAAGKINQSFFPKGGNALIPDAPSLQPASLTLQTWVKSVAPGNFRYVISKSRAAGGVSYAIYTGGGGGLLFFVNLASGGGTVFSPTVPPQVWDGAWHLVTASYDGSFVRMYLDGLEVGTGTVVPNANGIDYTSPNQLVFADYQAPGGLSFTGQIDDVQLYSRALTPEEVKSYYTAANLISWWRAETTADDSIGSNNGTVTGNTTYANSRLTGKAFNTTDGAVEIPDSAGLQPTNITIEALVSARTPGTNKFLISKSATASASSYAFSTGPNGGLTFSVNLSGSGVTTSPSASASIWNADFHHIAGTYDGQTVRLYLDGKEVGAGTPGSGTIQYSAAQNSGKLLFGNFAGDVSNNFAGILDEIKLFKTALSAAEIDNDSFKQVLIKKQPAGGSFTAGTNVNLAVQTQGSGVLEYQWLLNGTNIAGANSSAFTITNLQAASAGNYQVLISSGGLRYTNGISGNSFDVGKGALVRVQNNDAFSSQQFSIQVWARATAPGTFKYLFSKSRDPSFYSSSYGFYTAADGGLTFFVVLSPPPSNPTAFAFVTAAVGTNVWDGAWHQFTGTWDGEFVNLYVDGVLAQSVDSFGGTVDYQTSFLNGDILFGDVLLPSTDFHFPGNLDEIRFYSTVLSSDDVAATYPNTQNTVSTNTLVGWWKAENNTFDATGQNDGATFPPFGTLLSEVATITVGASPITLASPTVSAGNFVATVNGTAGQSYIVQRSTNLTSWTPIITNTAPFTFTNGISSASAYYRVLLSQP
jgi:hypothetical protein